MSLYADSNQVRGMYLKLQGYSADYSWAVDGTMKRILTFICFYFNNDIHEWCESGFHVIWQSVIDKCYN